MNRVILLQIAINFIKELLEFFGNSEVRTLAEIEAELFRVMKAFIQELIKAHIKLTDEAILNDKASRKERGLFVERREDKKPVHHLWSYIFLTGPIITTKKQKAYVYPLNEALRLDKYERLSGAVAIKLLETAGRLYTKSLNERNKSEISKQTVKNKIHSLNLEALKIKDHTGGKGVRVLYI